MNLISRWIISVMALLAAAWMVPGIHVEGRAWVVYVVFAVILGLVNAVVRPVLKLLTCPLIILTLGFFILVINGVTLLLASRIAEGLGVDFVVSGFWAAFWGALVVSIVTVGLSMMVRDE